MLVQEYVSLGFHAAYAAAYWVFRNSRYPGWFYPINRVKWIEYALSATAGTAAVVWSDTSPPLYWAIFLVLAAVAQQCVGFQIDKPAASVTSTDAASFASAVLLQIGEFLVVGSAASSTPLIATYVIMWSSFGIHAGIRMYAQLGHGKTTVGSRWTDDGWSEAVYSCLGWTAKCSIVAMAWASETLREEDVNMVAILVGVGCAVAIIPAMYRLPVRGAYPDRIAQ